MDSDPFIDFLVLGSFARIYVFFLGLENSATACDVCTVERDAFSQAVQ
jgi:hypothetical protein